MFFTACCTLACSIISSICTIMHCRSVRVLKRDGLEGSFGIGLRVSLAGISNVPEKRRDGCGSGLEHTLNYLPFVRSLFVSNFLFNKIIQRFVLILKRLYRFLDRPFVHHFIYKRFQIIFKVFLGFPLIHSLPIAIFFVYCVHFSLKSRKTGD